MTPRELSALARVCQKHGISHLKTKDLEITLAVGYLPPKPLTEKQLRREAELAEMASMSDEELALYSAAAPFDLTQDPKPGASE